MPSDLAARFMRVFEGAIRSHGTYREEDPEMGGKKTIKRTAQTVRSPPTVDLWDQHLRGERPLGVVPIREDDACLWGAVDIDDYTIDHGEMVADLRRRQLPAIVCRTKSGGAHVYLFFSEPIPAAEVVPRLRELAALLNHGDSEIFPKQIAVLADRGDLGSWLNMPYYGGDKTERCAMRATGLGMSMEHFLDMAEGMRLSRRGLADLLLSREVQGFESGPPCLESLIATGFPEHTRNNGIFALGTLAKKMDPDNWEAILEEWVEKYGEGFSKQELGGIKRQHRKKDYNYRCGDKPLNMRCNVAQCRTRPHGVNGGAGSVSILESLQILLTEPPIFFLSLKTGRTVELSASQILSAHDFQLAVLQQHQEVVPEYKRTDWTRWVTDVVDKAIRVEAPEDSGPTGRFEELLEQFLTDRHRAERRGELLLGKPWHDEEAGLVYFRIRDLETAMERVRFSCPDRHMGLRAWMIARLREEPYLAEHGQFWDQGRNVRTWRIRSSLFVWSQEPMDLPRHEEGPL